MTGAPFGAIHRPWGAENGTITVLKNPIFGGPYLPYFQDSYSEFLRAGIKLAKFFADFRILTISSRTKKLAKMSRFWDPQPKTAKSRRNQKISILGENLALILHLIPLKHISKPIFMPKKIYANFLKIVKNHHKMGPRTTVRPPNSEKSSRGEFLDLAPPLVRISRKSVTPNATCVVDLVHFLVQPLLMVHPS